MALKAKSGKVLKHFYRSKRNLETVNSVEVWIEDNIVKYRGLVEFI